MTQQALTIRIDSAVGQKILQLQPKEVQEYAAAVARQDADKALAPGASGPRPSSASQARQIP
jgi:hypothetical protein